MRKKISIVGISVIVVVIILLFCQGGFNLTEYVTGIAIGLSLLIPFIAYWGWKSEIDEMIRGKKEVIIQKNSLRLYKYPHIMFKQKVSHRTNMAYAVITAENIGELGANECNVEILLKNDEKTYCAKVLSALSADLQGRINPRTVSIGSHDTIGFHPIAISLDTLEAFLPTHSLNTPGFFTGTAVKHGKYEMLGKTIYDGKQSETISLGKIRIPDDFLKKSEIPHDIQVRIDEGGFAVYLEKYQRKVRAKFYGNHNDKDIEKIISAYLTGIPQIDNIIEDNGKLRQWIQKNGDVSIKTL